MITRQLLIQQSKEFLVANQSKDCAVLALALLRQVSYMQAHNHLKLYGYRENIGMPSNRIMESFNKTGLEMINLGTPTQPNGSRYTSRTIGRRYPSGCYLVFTRGHTFPMIDGQVHDWTEGRRHIVTDVLTVTDKYVKEAT